MQLLNTTHHAYIPTKLICVTACSSSAVQLLVVSPLTRALQTATLAFGDQPGCQVLVEPLWRERLYLSSDVGRSGQQLAQEFPQ
jgi:hypothetical protein